MTISIIAGKGDFPKIIAKHSINNIVICIKGLSKPTDFKNPTARVSLLEIEKLIEKLNNHKIKKIVFAGKFFRPDLNNNKIDNSSKKILKQILYKGDEHVLNIIKSFFLKNGFEIISPSVLLKNNLIKKNLIISKHYDENKINFLNKSAKNGINLLNKISKFDIGQSVVLLDKHIIGIEGLEGTNELIKRSGLLFKKYLKTLYPFGPILVKFPKKHQSLDLDMPVIGIETIELCKENNFLGVAVSSFGTLVLDKEKILNFSKSKDFYFCSIGD